MLPKFRNRFPFLPAALLRGLLYACIAGCIAGCMGGADDKPTAIDDEPNATEVENEVTGSLYLAGGEPAVGAKVRIYPVGFSPKPGAAESDEAILAITDAKGVFRVDSLAPGKEYNVLGSLDNLGSYLDSVVFDSRIRVLPPDTLDAPGSIVGYVAMQPNHILSSATVEILGTQYFANVDQRGTFRFPSLPAGRFSIRVSTTQGQYTPLYAELRVRVGMTDTLSDTLRMEFTGIPVVGGLRAVYDTLAGTARISWGPVDYPLLQGYHLFRDEAGAIRPAIQPLERVSDTQYVDRLFSSGLSEAEDEAREGEAVSVEYRVKALDSSENPGPNFGFVALTAPSPAWVRTYMYFRDQGFSWEASPDDSIRVILDFRNPTRSNDSLFWYIDGSDAPARIRTRFGLAGVDTLAIKTPSEPGPLTIRVRIKDDGGTVWGKSRSLEVLRDAPVADAGADSIGSIGSRFLLHGTAAQKFGTIVKWEWDVGNLGVFTRTSGPDTLITLPAAPDSHYVCRLKVTDDDGMQSIDTLILVVSPSSRIDFPVIPRLAAVIPWEEEIYVFGGDTAFAEETKADRVFSIDTRTGSIHPKGSMPGPVRIGAKAVEYQGRIHLVGGSAKGVLLSRMDVYDPSTDQWSAAPPMPNAYAPVVAAVVRGKLYTMGSVQGNPNSTYVYEYDGSTGAWTRANEFSTRAGINSFAVLDDKIYVQSPNDMMVYTVPEKFAPVGEAEDRLYLKSMIQPTEGWGTLIAWNGAIYRFGNDRIDLRVSVQSYLPGDDAWKIHPPLLKTRYRPRAMRIGNRVYVNGGDCTFQQSHLYPQNTCGDAEVYTLP